MAVGSMPCSSENSASSARLSLRNIAMAARRDVCDTHGVCCVRDEGGGSQCQSVALCVARAAAPTLRQRMVAMWGSRSLETGTSSP